MAVKDELKKLRRYKFTILFTTVVVIVMVFIVALMFYRVGEKMRCDNRGGVYVETFGGYECVGKR